MVEKEHLIDLVGISKEFDGVQVLKNINLYIRKKEFITLLGPSGCGKTTTLRIIGGFETPSEGQVLFGGQDISALPPYKRRVNTVFQKYALFPHLNVFENVAFGLRLQKLDEKEIRSRCLEMLELVGIPGDRYDEYPHQFSGGMKQRVLIAIGLACSPKLLIADEPTSALDVTIQAQILDLLKELKDKINSSIMLITHDLSVVAEVCSRVAVMYLGQIVEEAGVNDIFDNPGHPYTRGLIRSIPRIEGEREKRLYQIAGTVPMLSQIPQGCRFAPRCPRATEACRAQMPDLVPVSGTQRVRCWHADGAPA